MKPQKHKLNIAGYLSRRVQAYAQNKTQAFCLIISTVTFIALTPLLRDGYELEARVTRENINYVWPKLSDLYFSLILYLLFSRLRESVTLRLSPFMRSKVKPKYTGKERD